MILRTFRFEEALRENLGYARSTDQLCMISVTGTVVFIAQPPETDGVPERSVYCDPVHITRIEPLDGTKPKRRPTKRR